MERKHKSGSQKRKERDAKQNFIASCPPISIFFSRPIASSSEQLTINDRPAASTLLDNDGPGSEHLPANPVHLMETFDTQPDNSPQDGEGIENESDEESSSPGPASAHLAPTVCEPSEAQQSNIRPSQLVSILPPGDYPTNPYFFKDQPLTPDVIRAVIEHGPCQPGMKDGFDNFTYDQEKRRFNPSWYKRQVGNSSVQRSWLVYSPTAHRMFCCCCWLFGNKSNDSAGRVWADPNLGLSSYRKGIEKIDRHEKSKAHREAERTYLMTKYRITKDNTVIAELLKAEREQVEKNRRVLRRLVDVTLFLA